MTLEPVFRPFRTDDTLNICEIAVKAWVSIFDAYRQDMGDKFFNHLYPAYSTVSKDKPNRVLCDRVVLIRKSTN